MKVFKIRMEVDGETTKLPGKVITEIENHEVYVLAETIEEVFSWASNHAISSDGTVQEVKEVISAVVQLTKKEEF